MVTDDSQCGNVLHCSAVLFQHPFLTFWRSKIYRDYRRLWDKKGQSQLTGSGSDVDQHIGREEQLVWLVTQSISVASGYIMCSVSFAKQ